LRKSFGKTVPQH